MGAEHHGIMEVKTFVDDGGREVKQFTQVFGKEKDPCFYKGRVMVRVQPVSPQGIPMPPQTIPFEFVFPENTVGLKMAFDTFDKVAKTEVDEHAKKMREQQAANRVVPAAAMPALLGPDGKIVKG
jgi:hypothetical protein